MEAFSPMELIGWISGISLAICGIPLAASTIKSGKAPRMNLTFLYLWLIGELLGLIYTVSLSNYPLVFNYLVNSICLIIIFIYLIAKGD